MPVKAGALSIALLVMAFLAPLFYNAVSPASSAEPQLVIEQKGKCVKETEYMRRYHMNLLKTARDSGVREGVRLARHGLKGCISCHPKRGEFCDRCHEYSGVTPECWNCHTYPV